MWNTVLSLLAASVRTVPAEEIPLGKIIAELAIAFVLLVAMLIIRRRSLKIMCVCGAEICLFLACKLFFGSDSIITQIMCWFTAAVACVITVAIVNAINWGNLRGKRDL